MDSPILTIHLLGKPGIPVSNAAKTEDQIRAVERALEKQGCKYIKLPQKGTPKAWQLDTLPTEYRKYRGNMHLETIVSSAVPAVREAAPTPALNSKPAPLPDEKLPDWQRTCKDARLGLLRLVKAAVENGFAVKKAIARVVEAAKYGDLGQMQPLVAQANARKGESGKRTLSCITMMRWWSDWKHSGFVDSALVPDNERPPRPEPVWAEVLLKEWRKGTQKPALTDVLEKLKGSVSVSVVLPSYDQARRYLAALGQLERSKGRSTGIELMPLKSYRRRLTDHMYPGDAYTADGHCYDGEVCHPYTGKPFRPEITPIIDIASRMVTGWSVDLAESGLAVLDALRVACELFGPPVIFYTDNGKGFKNQLMTAPGTGILVRLHIAPEYSRPRNPQGHGISERGHKTILVKAAKTLLTYIGKDMDGDTKQKVYKQTRAACADSSLPTPLIEWDDFVEQINRAIIDYNNRPHSGLPAYRDPATRKRVHYTPWQAWQAGMQRMKADLPEDKWTTPANELPDLYHPAMTRKVDRCWVRMGKRKDGLPQMYYSRDLENWHGELVQVAYSPSNASKVWVRTLDDGMLIAVATLEGNSAEYFAQTKLEEKREERAKGRQKRLERQAHEIELERRGPKSVVIEHSPEVLAKAPPLGLPTPPPAVDLSDGWNGLKQHEKYEVWGRIDAAIAEGREVSTEDRNRWVSFPGSAAWQSERAFDPKYRGKPKEEQP